MTGAAWTAPLLLSTASAPAWAASCLPTTTLFNTYAEGRLVGGTIAGLNLDALAAVEGAEATVNAGTGSPVQDLNPLDISALGAVQISLGGFTRALSTILAIPTDVPVGVINQVARASSDGTSNGASGAVADNGTLQLDGSAGGAPQLASLDLRTILENATSSPQLSALISNVTNLNLQVGAAAGRSFIDTRCLSNGSPDVITRQYLLAYLRLVLQSQLVGALLTNLGSVTISANGILTALQTVPILGPLLTSLATVTATVEVDTDPLTNASIPASGVNPVTINFGAGTVVVDLESLLGEAYSAPGSTWLLNELAPNTRLFDAPLPTAVLPGIVARLARGLVTALASSIKLDVEVRLSVPILGSVTVVRILGTLQQLLDGESVLTIANLPISATPALITNVGNALLDALVVQVTSLLGDVNGLLGDLFSVLQNILALTINAQTTSNSGAYDVSALRVNVLNTLGLLDLKIARGVGGPNVTRPA